MAPSAWTRQDKKPSFGEPALVFEVSATISVERIHRVLGENASVWSIGVPAPHNDVVKTSRQKAEFRTLAAGINVPQRNHRRRPFLRLE